LTTINSFYRSSHHGSDEGFFWFLSFSGQEEDLELVPKINPVGWFANTVSSFPGELFNLDISSIL